MSLIHDESQVAMATEVRRALEARVTTADLLPLVEAKGQWHAPFWDMAREQGWCGVAIAEEFGGLGLGLVEQGLIAHQVGRSLAGAPFLTSGWAVARALANSAHAGAKSQWLPRIASGETIAALGFAERQNPLPQRPALSFAQGQLHGTKPAVSGGSRADLALLLAADGETPVLVLAELAGVERSVLGTYDNARCIADLVFAGQPAVALARGDEAIALARDALAALAVITAHEQTGGAEALMERARDYALTRKAFGQPIGAFQSVKHRIAELYGLVELARAGSIHAAARDGTAEFLRAAAAARIQATEAYDTAARDCVQVHGGIGATWEAGLHLHMRRARSLANEAGNLLFWEDLLVNELEAEAA